MSSLWIVVLIGLGLGTAGLAVFLARLLSYRREVAGVDSGEFSLERYEPMSRLLDGSDFAFLAAQPGATNATLARLKRERRRILRMYLRELAADFQHLHRQARLIVATAPEQHADLVGVLLRQQVSFWAALGMVEFQLALNSVGLGAINPRKLLDATGSVKSAIERATATPGPVAI